MDTTLRDGEQTQGVSYAPLEKLHIAKLLLRDLKVDRIEIASARVSSGEFEALSKITEWARHNNLHRKIETLGFVDGDISLNWINDAGGKVDNLLCKGSLRHLEKQLRKTPEQHVKDITGIIRKAEMLEMEINIYLEDWSNGMISSQDYVFFMLDSLKDENIRRFMLPDTLGILNPEQTYDFCKIVRDRYPDLHFDFHSHNDYDLAVANVFSAVKAGINGIHTTVNGLGERAGNAPLSSVISVLRDQLHAEVGVNEFEITKVSKIVETFSGIRIPVNKPVIGENVFTQTSGVHADGDTKDNLYYNNLMPERFGRKRKYALGKQSGKATVKKNLEEFGLSLSPESLAKVTQRVIELGDKKENVTPDDLPFIIADVLGNDHSNYKIFIKNYSLSLSYGLKPSANVQIEIEGKLYQETSSGDGQYDAFMKALRNIYDKLEKQLPNLIDYMVSIPPGGATDALVETVITWDYKGREFKTKGLDVDQTESAIKATERMLNILEGLNENENKAIPA
ncbi:MAG: 2-isopropylmalate synthase [Bacteroidetes bacterium GWE2_41_25]|nr:MAG: 2-isopropylmalate synthase [Bacteroidetes bacterium GWA2_40_15]OFX86952.1 MAG: 2-isopropylmalate synthase [Bacteroidetes bacterium GWC2_40_22]OFX92178.1 MAG: 2-isopropylmalate synthase [Bacteroidetes bacterium GWE2_41_25]HBH82291.1 2-isopropylmalate synthase [Bacteroidales bacterium]HBQ81460.1 2-isopropylmalate synthase [Bacteroidales bacterium]